MPLLMRVVEVLLVLFAVGAVVASVQSHRWQFGVCAVGFVLLAVIPEMLLREWRQSDFVVRWTPLSGLWGGLGLLGFVAMGVVMSTLGRGGS